MYYGEDVIYNGCVIVGNELLGFLRGYQEYSIPSTVTEIGSSLADSYAETFGDDFINPTFDLSALLGCKINISLKDYLSIQNIRQLSFPLSEW